MQNIRTLLGQRVRELRKERGWSQELLGEKASLHPTYIGGIERGERNVSLENLDRLASTFKLSLDELFTLPREKRTRREVTESKILSLLRNQTSEALDFLLRFLEIFHEWTTKKSDLTVKKAAGRRN